MAAPPPQQSSQRPLSSQIETLSLVSGLVEAFKAFDSDSDGLIAAEELGGMMASLGYDAGEGEVAEMMRTGDSDGDGLLSLSEVAAMMADAAGDVAGALGAALSALVGDGGAAAGTTAVGAEELYEVLSCMGSLSADNCRDIVASLDGDGDGALDLEDLKLVVQALL